MSPHTKALLPSPLGRLKMLCGNLFATAESQAAADREHTRLDMHTGHF